MPKYLRKIVFTMPHFDAHAEFDRQVKTLLEKGYPRAANITSGAFLKHAEPLRAQLADIPSTPIDFETGTLPFVMVVQSTLVTTDTAMSLIERDGKNGITKLFPHQPTDFAPLESVSIPSVPLYLLIDIDRGRETINLPPNEALKRITTRQRSPLTIDEGVAIVTHYPDFLVKNNCFSLLASRHQGDQRVPAIWINGQKQPNLGWCWDGNPHTWLGSASCAER